MPLIHDGLIQGRETYSRIKDSVNENHLSLRRRTRLGGHFGAHRRLRVDWTAGKRSEQKGGEDRCDEDSHGIAGKVHYFKGWSKVTP